MSAAPQADDEEAVRAQAIKLLARREHAPAELRRKLDQRGFERTAITHVLEALARQDLLSSQRYAAGFVRARIERGQGPVRIAAELTRAGVDEAEVDSALAEADVDWQELAAGARQKRFGARPPADRSQRLKQMRFLQRRGFDHDAIAAAVDVDAG